MLKANLCVYNDETITITGDSGQKSVTPAAGRT